MKSGASRQRLVDCPSISNLLNNDLPESSEQVAWQGKAAYQESSADKTDELAMMSSRNFKEEYLVAESSVGKASQSPVSSTSWANQRLNLVGHLLNKQSDDDDDDDEE